jgi:bifunctional non-homologous end joining protein LigD
VPRKAIRVDGHEIDLGNPDKLLFPEAGLTKGDLVEYYQRIASCALPYCRDRPLTMQRFPDGIEAEGFYQKQIPDYFPSWIDRVRLDKEDGTITQVLANDAATLVYLANQACVTLHLSLSRESALNYPDRMIFDLDPSDDDFGKVQDAALALKSLLDDLSLRSFVQTTGSRGLHILVPLDGSADFAVTRHVAHAIADLLVEAHPRTLTTEQRKAARGQRVFIDYLRNAYGQTSVAPYAVRARPTAPVAMPLDWSEVGRSDLGPQKYTTENVFRRMGQKTDPWHDLAATRQSLRPVRPVLDERRV